MDSLTTGPIAELLASLFQKAEQADGVLSGDDEDFLGDRITQFLDEEAKDYKATYQGLAGHYLNVSPVFGRFLYMCVRARSAIRVVEFGTSFGISAIHLACALRDSGGGLLIGTELEPSKAEAAQANIAAAGLSDLVDIRVGDALETLKDGIGGDVDLVHLDGAFSLYLPVLKLLEPHLKPGALVIGENSFEQGYLDYVRNPENGYLSVTMPFQAGRGNEFSIVTR